MTRALPQIRRGIFKKKKAMKKSDISKTAVGRRKRGNYDTDGTNSASGIKEPDGIYRVGGVESTKGIRKETGSMRHSGNKTLRRGRRSDQETEIPAGCGVLPCLHGG